MTAKLVTLLAAAVLGATAASTADAAFKPNPSCLRCFSVPHPSLDDEPNGIRYSSVQPNGIRWSAAGQGLRSKVRPTFSKVRF